MFRLPYSVDLLSDVPSDVSLDKHGQVYTDQEKRERVLRKDDVKLYYGVLVFFFLESIVTGCSCLGVIGPGDA